MTEEDTLARGNAIAAAQILRAILTELERRDEDAAGRILNDAREGLTTVCHQLRSKWDGTDGTIGPDIVDAAWGFFGGVFGER